MNDRQNMTIILLLISAAFLASLLFLAQTTDQQAWAGNSSARFDDYIMCPGARSDSADNLYIIDVQTEKLAVYWIQPGTTNLEPTDVIDLKRYFSTQR